MFESNRKNYGHFVQFTSDMVMDSDVETIMAEIERSLAAGIGNIVFLVTVGSLANQVRLSGLLLKCKEIVNRHNARLLLVEKNTDGQDVYSTMCHSLQIPRYSINDNDDAWTRLSDKEIN